MQDMPGLSGTKAGAQAPGTAMLSKQASERKGSTADQPKQLLVNDSKAFPALASQNIAASSAMLSRASRQTAGVPASDGVRQKGRLAVGDAEPTDIDEDDFFMSSSAGEVERDEQPAVLNQPSEVPGATPHALKSADQQEELLDSVPLKQSKQRKGIQRSRKLPPGQYHPDHGHKPHKRATLPPPYKATKPLHKDRGAAKEAAHGRLRADVRGQPSRGQPHGEPSSAIAIKQSPGAPEKRPGLPLRTRAEGGRKRRKKA